MVAWDHFGWICSDSEQRLRIDENQSTAQQSEDNEASTSAAAARLDSDEDSDNGESEVSTFYALMNLGCSVIHNNQNVYQFSRHVPWSLAL